MLEAGDLLGKLGFTFLTIGFHLDKATMATEMAAKACCLNV